jgi:hypothetical protein
MVETLVGWSIKIILCTALGLDDNYVEDRIKTIFLDAIPVDNISTASVSDKSVLELSGAMPGLAGAALRRGGRLAFLERCLNKKYIYISYLPYFNLLKTTDNSKKAGLWKSQKIF